MARMIRMNIRAIMFYSIMDVRQGFAARGKHTMGWTVLPPDKRASAPDSESEGHQRRESADFLIACPRLLAGTGASSPPASRADGHNPSTGLLR